MAVETIAAHGKEKVAGGSGARVDGVAGDQRARRHWAKRTALRAQRPRRLPPLQVSDSLLFTDNPRFGAQVLKHGKRAISASSKGIVRAGEDLFFLVAFAGEEDNVAGRGGLEREADGGGAVGLDGVLRRGWL